jgi:hypothetical protein
MVVIKFATYSNRCPFSKSLIHPTNKICLFNEEQFEAFKKMINKTLPSILPQELIDLIIEKTGYKKLLHRFGLIKYTHWTANARLKPKNRKNKTDLIIEFAKLTGFSDEETDETESESED